jgi:hypothetical protein
MEGILALMIPVLAMATGFVAVLRMPPEKFAGRGRRGGQMVVDAPQTAALIDEVAQLRDELARVNERLDFTERLLMGSTPAARLATPVGADPLAQPAGV